MERKSGFALNIGDEPLYWIQKSWIRSQHNNEIRNSGNKYERMNSEERFMSSNNVWVEYSWRSMMTMKFRRKTVNIPRGKNGIWRRPGRGKFLELLNWSCVHRSIMLLVRTQHVCFVGNFLYFSHYNAENNNIRHLCNVFVHNNFEKIT